MPLLPGVFRKILPTANCMGCLWGHRRPGCQLGWDPGLGAVFVNTAPPWGTSWLSIAPPQGPKLVSIAPWLPVRCTWHSLVIIYGKSPVQNIDHPSYYYLCMVVLLSSDSEGELITTQYTKEHFIPKLTEPILSKTMNPPNPNHQKKLSV